MAAHQKRPALKSKGGSRQSPPRRLRPRSRATSPSSPPVSVASHSQGSAKPISSPLVPRLNALFDLFSGFGRREPSPSRTSPSQYVSPGAAAIGVGGMGGNAGAAIASGSDEYNRAAASPPTDAWRVAKDKSRPASPHLDSSRFAKLIRDTKVLKGTALTLTEADLIFAAIKGSHKVRSSHSPFCFLDSLPPNLSRFWSPLH